MIKLKILKLQLNKLIPSLKNCMRKFGLIDATMTEIELKKFISCPLNIYARDSEIATIKGIFNIDNGSMGDTHWTCFYIKDNSEPSSHAGSTKTFFISIASACLLNFFDFDKYQSRSFFIF